MRNRMTILPAFITASAATTVIAGVHAGDVLLTVEGNAITTNLDAVSGPEPARVFASDLASLAGFWTTDEPGFDSEPGTFPIGSEIGFVITDAVRVWDGSDFDAISDSPISMEFSVLGPVTSPAAPNTEAVGFTIPVQPDGAWHRHYDFFLEPPADQGVYLLALRLTHTGALDDSKTFYIVFNQGEDEATHDSAVGFIADAIACPADINSDGVIDTADLGILINAFGSNDPAADLNNDTIVDTADLGILIAAFGTTCP
jgi:hypothetical protein